MMFVMYGIKNCDTIKKARLHLEQRQQPYRFHDYRVDGINAELLQELATALGWQALLNTRGTTYRALADEEKADMNESKALALMLAHPAMIKRPVLKTASSYVLGYSSAQYDAL